MNEKDRLSAAGIGERRPISFNMMKTDGRSTNASK